MTDDKIYDALAGDIYGQGKVLALSKYKYLKRSYNCFLGGMAAAIFGIFLSGVRDVLGRTRQRHLGCSY